MPVLRINATATGLSPHDTSIPTERHLCTAAARQGPAIIMVHGYKYAPGSKKHCPHRKIFGDMQAGWPKGLGFGQGDRGEGLGIAFGWYARGRLKKVHRRAAQLGESLAIVIAMLRDHAPDRPVHVIAHSMGVETALNALAFLPAGSVDRMVLLTGASHANRALDLLQTPAGQSAEVLNVTSRENDLFDAAFECMVPAKKGEASSIGNGIDANNIATLQLDCPETLSRLRLLGHEIAASEKRICHWSTYRRPGVMALYNRFLRAPETLSLAQLAALGPTARAPRWSRLFEAPAIVQKTGSVLLPSFSALMWPNSVMRAATSRRKSDEHAY